MKWFLSYHLIIYTWLLDTIEHWETLLNLKSAFLVLVKLFPLSNINSYVSFELSLFNHPPVIKNLLLVIDDDTKFSDNNLFWSNFAFSIVLVYG